MALLRVGERDQADQPASFAGVVVGNGGLEVLTQWCGLTELPAQPTPQAHRRLVGHVPVRENQDDTEWRLAAAVACARVQPGGQALSASSGSRSFLPSPGSSSPSRL